MLTSTSGIIGSVTHTKQLAIEGTALSIPSITKPHVAGLNTTDIAFIESTADELRTYRFNGSTWSQVGNSFAAGAVDDNSITTLTSTSVAMITGTGDLGTYNWDGTNWSLVGTKLALSGETGPIQLTALNTTDIALTSNGGSNLYTYRFNGSTWSQVGNALATLAGSVPVMGALTSTKVGLILSGTTRIQTYQWDGTDWAAVGNQSEQVENTTGGMARVDNSKVLVASVVLQKIQGYAFNGTDWSVYGNSLSITSPSAADICAMGAGRYAYIDESNELLTAYTFV